MKYIFRGRLCGYVCKDCVDWLSRVRVRLYRLPKQVNVTALAVAHPKETFRLLTDDEVREKQSRLIAEIDTDDAGNFVFELGERDKYDGGAFEIDVYCGSVPHGVPPTPPPPPVQASITTVQPLWRETAKGVVAVFEYCFPERYWCALLARRGIWVICGRLTTCTPPKVPIAGATVFAFDADWLQDDSLGSATTDAAGHFLIHYTRAAFEKTIFSNLNIELVGGPDVYFRAEFAGTPILEETQADGRKPGRENVGHCVCVELCTDKLPHTPPERTPHWTKVAGRFNVRPDTSAPNDNFDANGYAGSPTEAYVFGGGVALNGNCPFKNAAAPTHSLKYRFMVAEWGYNAPGPRPGVLPSIAPSAPPAEPDATWKVVTGGATWLGDVYYNDGVNPTAKKSVSVAPDPNGWIALDGLAVTVPLSGSGTTTVNLSDDVNTGNWVRSGNLLDMSSGPITGAQPVAAWSGDRTQAGRFPTDAEKVVIRRFRMVFQVRDISTNADIFTEVLDSIVFDNSSVVEALNIQQLLTDSCNPITGLQSIDVRYTIDHPHLNTFHLWIKNNAGIVHAEATMPGGDFTAGSFFFRGGASGPVPLTGPGGFNVDISADPPCAYAVWIRFGTRHYVPGGGNDEVLYCIE
jgi:hypothetical protein